MTDAHDAVTKILAVIDEFPSEPLSFERREVEEKLYLLICSHTQETEDELDEAFNLGFEEGEYSGKAETAEEYEDRISELEEEIEDLRAELQEVTDRSFAEGFEAASNNVNANLGDRINFS